MEWYSIINGETALMQGDFFFSCKLLNQISIIDTTEIDAETEIHDIVILSQSCDLAAKKIDRALVCPVYQLETLSGLHADYKNKKAREELRKGNRIGYHLLNKPPHQNGLSKDDFYVVDFKKPYSVALNILEELTNHNPTRLRLNSPYREHLSQAFARFFMRVGFPSDIPSFQ
jgi:hypothetical protein